MVFPTKVSMTQLLFFTLCIAKLSNVIKFYFYCILHVTQVKCQESTASQGLIDKLCLDHATVMPGVSEIVFCYILSNLL